ncbi:ROK family protein [Diaminobutyricibacter sp. McL0618]|uniref:ROK family protein n=1 Tax=Leifsonia sp. McL0618 TaxID=3415677 RepID=UPI003CED5EC0
MSTRKQVTATTSTLARVNQTAIIEALRNTGALSRQQLGVITGLSPATINRLTSTLIDEGLVVAAGQEPSTGGRPSVLLRYAGGTRLVASIQLRADMASGVLVDFDGKIVFRRDVAFGPRLLAPQAVDEDARARDQQARLDKTLELFDFLIATAETMGTPCLAVGVAVPGVVQHPEGVVGRMPELGWTDVPLGRLLRERTGLPIVVENDANALAYGELHRGAGRGLSSLVALFLENGLGAGIITNGELHRGARAEAGEIGYLLMERSSLDRSYSEYGDLEDRIGSIALTRRARERSIPIPAKGVLTAEDVFELAGRGNADAREMADEILDMVALAVAAMVIILDPELVVVGSSFVGSADTVIPGIQERLRGRIIRVPRLEAATHRNDAVLIGAAELAAAEVNGFAYVAY